VLRLASPRKVRVFVVVYDATDRWDGPAGDGSAVARFASPYAASDYATGRTYGGKPAEVCPLDVSLALAARWGL